MPTRIKVCGVRTPEAVFAAADAGADAVGFVFHPKSVRFVEPEDAWELVNLLPPFVASVGLFVDADIEKFMELEELCPTTISQLHGQEDVELVRQCGPGVIKAIRFDAATIRAELARWEAVDELDAILVDGSSGGGGLAFDWKRLADELAEIAKPVILAGGLTPENVGEAIRLTGAQQVDVSSGVESRPGEKDPARIAAFVRAAHAAERTLA